MQGSIVVAVEVPWAPGDGVQQEEFSRRTGVVQDTRHVTDELVADRDYRRVRIQDVAKYHPTRVV